MLRSSICRIICQLSYRELTEVWIKCNNVTSLLSFINSLISSSVLLATGSVNGKVYKVFPERLDDLVTSSLFNYVFEPGSSILLRHCEDDQSKLADAVLPYCSKIRLKRSYGIVRAVLSKPLSITYLFDNGIRVLKPITIPPILLRSGKNK